MVSKLPAVGTTIFTIMSQMAQEYKAINLAQGFPDFPCSTRLQNLVSKYINAGWNQYAPMAGTMALRERIAWKTEKLYGYCPDVNTEITVTCGATEACFAAITACVSPGDEVIIFEPAFDCYAPAIELNGGRPVYIQLSYPGFEIPWEEVKRKISDRTRLIIINSPHNPTGTTISPNDITELEQIIKDREIFLLSDEVYEHIIFDGKAHESLLKYPLLREKAMVISSFGKTFHTTGWRLGYCIAPENLSVEFRKVHQYVTFSAPTPLQLATAEFLEDETEFMELPDFYQQKRNLFLDLMKESKFAAVPSPGTYFQLFSFKNISNDPDVLMAEKLTKETGVASIPVSVFYKSRKDENLLRFCFAKEDITLEKAAEKLCRI